MKKLFIVAVITALLTMTTGCGNDESNKDVANTVTTTVAVTTEEQTTIEPTEEPTEGTTTGAVLSVPQMCYDPDSPYGTISPEEYAEDDDEDNEPFTGPTAAQPVGTVHPVS